MTDNLRWLHLSDFHVGKDKYEEKKLFSNILNHVEDECLNGKLPDLVFITGDIANRGSTDEYQVFIEEFLLPLIEILDISDWEEKIFIVPGNHDLKREFVIDIYRKERLQSSSDFFKCNSLGQKKRALHEGRAFEDFGNFIVENNFVVDNWLASENGAFSKIITFKEKSIGIVGINTAWLCQDNNDKEKLSPGIDLLNSSIKKISHCSIKLLLGHHPLDWFEENHRQTIEAILADNNIIYLHGHLHKNRVSPLEIGNGKFLQIQSGASFQIEEHSTSEWKNGFIWGEINFEHSKLYVQPRYWKNKDRRWGVSDDLHEDNKSERNDWWHYLLPQNSVKIKETIFIENIFTIPNGWAIIDNDFFENRKKRPANKEMFIQFFDGAIPNWNKDFLNDLPLREGTQTALSTLMTNQNEKKSTMFLFSGAGGEGKSTALYQCAYKLYKEGWNVLWHAGTNELSLETLRNVPQDKPFIIISDDADKIVKSIISNVEWVNLNQKNIHFLFASRRNDWMEAEGNKFNWQQKCIFHEVIFGKLSYNESKNIVKLWTNFGKDGLKGLFEVTTEDAISKLENSSDDHLSGGEGAFLGAMLEIRLADGLKDHVRTILSRLNNIKIKSTSYTLLDAFAVIAYMHKEGLGNLSEPVLAQYLFANSKKSIRGNVINKLGKEAAATPAGDYIFTRHSMIADSACSMLSLEFDIDPISVYTKLGLAASEARSNSFIPNFKFWQYDYPNYFIINEESYIGLSIAREQFEQESNDTHLLTNLAKLYRQTNNPKDSAQLFHDFDGLINTDRVLYHEWATSESLSNNIELSIWLDGTALSDYITGKIPTKENAQRILYTLCENFSILYERYRISAFRDARLAAAILAKYLDLNAEKTEYFSQHATEAISQGSKISNSINAHKLLEKGIENIWESLTCKEELIHKIPTKSGMAFTKFTNLITNFSTSPVSLAEV